MTNKLPDSEIIAHCALLKGLPPAEITTILAHGHRRHVAAGAYFLHQGEASETMYILTQGRVKLISVSPDGHQVIVGILQPGNGLGIIVSLSNMVYPVSAEAIEDCTAYAWQRADMTALMRQYPQLALNGIEMIGQRFAQLQERFRDVSTLRVEQRVALALVRQLGQRIEQGVLIDLPLTREELAQMTGTNIFNISRILSKWEQADFISTGRKRIVVRNAHALVAIAEDLPTRSAEKQTAETAER
jgi:CRP-like cAMP-binding protein